MAAKPQIPKGPGDKWKLPSHYQVKQVIGNGSYGSVCEAFCSKSQRLVAVKRVGHMFEDLIDCKRILREVAILGKLNSDHIVKLYDLPLPEDPRSFDELYIVMEICDSDLKKLCRTDVTLTPLHINTLLYNTLVGVKYLHSAGIYHRDMKPANCLVNQDCSVKICDFGLSRAVAESSSAALQETPRGAEEGSQRGGGPIVPSTQRMKRHLTGHVVTRWYRAPELILLQENYTESIDMWSVGCIYAELLGMLEGTRTQDRGPLFPGSSCFPLSPDHKHKSDFKYHTKGKHDQLNMIFNLLGTPPDSVLDELERDDAKRYLKCFSARPGETLAVRYKHVTNDMRDLLAQMLMFSPSNRVTVVDALNASIFSEMRDTSKERVFSANEGETIRLAFESEPDLDEGLLRNYFMKEIDRFRK